MNEHTTKAKWPFLLLVSGAIISLVGVVFLIAPSPDWANFYIVIGIALLLLASAWKRKGMIGAKVVYMPLFALGMISPLIAFAKIFASVAGF